jgi:hypothetical protein
MEERSWFLNVLCSDLHSVKTYRQLIVSLLFPLLWVALTKWNFPNNRTHKLCDGLFRRAIINKHLHKNAKASGQIDNEAL